VKKYEKKVKKVIFWENENCEINILEYDTCLAHFPCHVSWRGDRQVIPEQYLPYYFVIWF